jgi:hypothetical protein
VPLQYTDDCKGGDSQKDLRISLAGFPENGSDEIDEAELISPTRLVLQIDVGKCRCDQYRADIPARNLFCEPEAFGGRDYGVCGAMKYENWNAKLCNLAIGREGSEFGCVGVDGGE